MLFYLNFGYLKPKALRCYRSKTDSPLKNQDTASTVGITVGILRRSIGDTLSPWNSRNFSGVSNSAVNVFGLEKWGLLKHMRSWSDKEELLELIHPWRFAFCQRLGSFKICRKDRWLMSGSDGPVFSERTVPRCIPLCCFQHCEHLSRLDEKCATFQGA